MIYLSVGTNWNIDKLSILISLNEKYMNSVQCESVYGSLRRDLINIDSARPDWRLSETGMDNIKRFIELAHKNKINIEYTINAPLLESVQQYHFTLNKIKESLKQIEGLGIDRYIVTSPLLMEIIKETSVLPIKVSTILAPRYISNLKNYKEMGVDMVCVDIYNNRNIDFLINYNVSALKHGITVELLVNEFCMYGDAPCADILRSACYAHSALGGNKEHYFNDWPFGRCQQKRKEQPISWLKSPFILPQHMGMYSNFTGINHFKISGRTNTSNFWNTTVLSYYSQNFQGELLSLYEQPQQTKASSNFNPLISELENIGFFDIWFKNKKSCVYNCGTSCFWCDEKYKELNK
jgi:collagenase-like PrtC family protease